MTNKSTLHWSFWIPWCSYQDTIVDKGRCVQWQFHSKSEQARRTGNQLQNWAKQNTEETKSIARCLIGIFIFFWLFKRWEVSELEFFNNKKILVEPHLNDRKTKDSKCIIRSKFTLQFTTGDHAHGGVGEVGQQTRREQLNIGKEEKNELIYIDIDNNLDGGRGIVQNLHLERGFDLERGLDQKSRALQQAGEAATVKGGAFLGPYPGSMQQPEMVT